MFKYIKSAFDKIKTNKTPVEKEETLGMKSVIALFVEAASVDGIVAESEKKYILKILKEKFHLNIEESTVLLEEAISASNDQIEIWSKTKNIRDEMEYEDRLKIIEMLWEIVLIDGVVDQFESQLMRRITGLLYIKDIDSGIAKKNVIENTL